MIEQDDRTSAGTLPSDSGLVIRREFAAPRLLVWRAWTEPEQFARWWGPRGFTIPHCTIDLRPGGRWRYCMRSPEGEDVWAEGIYQEVVEPERIVSLDHFSDEVGHAVTIADLGWEGDWPAEWRQTVTFTEHEGRTTVTVHQSVPDSVARDMQAHEGWHSSFDKLDELLADL